FLDASKPLGNRDALPVDAEEQACFTARSIKEELLLDSYQQEALDLLKSKSRSNHSSRGLLVMPPAAGKTVVVLRLLFDKITSCYERDIPVRAVFVAPNALLADQAYQMAQAICPPVSRDGRSTIAFRLNWTKENIEIESDSRKVMKRHDFSMRVWHSRLNEERNAYFNEDFYELDETRNNHGVLFASKTALASINVKHSRLKYFGRSGSSVKFLFFDEAHHAPARGWSQVIESIISSGKKRVFCVGLTATAFRGSRESEETAAFLEHYPVYIKKSFEEYWSIDSSVNSVLARPKFRCVVLTRNGSPIVLQWKKKSSLINRFENRFEMLEEKEERNIRKSRPRRHGLPFEEPKVVREVIEEIDKWIAANVNNPNGPKTIVFCRNIAHAEILFDQINRKLQDDAKNTVVMVHSRQEPMVKWYGVRRFRTDPKCRTCICVEMLAQGWDVPSVERIIVTRWTRSERLIWQMIGRGLRGRRVSGGTEELEVVWFKVQFGSEEKEFKVYTPADFYDAVRGTSVGLGIENEALAIKVGRVRKQTTKIIKRRRKTKGRRVRSRGRKAAHQIRKKGKRGSRMTWTEARERRLIGLYRRGLTYIEIALRMDLTRGQVHGKIYELQQAGRIKRRR
ncbi:MAG: DEAD/DEAH box helicase family protein, partial [Kosmotogaceae bacterium]|nr:DEAD/DEAH box helicase family protein [Kosmotogaceae bacterium]